MPDVEVNCLGKSLSSSHSLEVCRILIFLGDYVSDGSVGDI